MFSVSYTGLLLTFSQQFVFCFYSEFISFIWNTKKKHSKSKNCMCSDLTHVISFSLVVLIFDLIKINTHILLKLHIRPGGCVIEEYRMRFSWSYASPYWTILTVHPSCPHDYQRVVIKLIDLTLAELHFIKLICTVAWVRQKWGHSIFQMSFHHLSSGSCSKGHNMK